MTTSKLVSELEGSELDYWVARAIGYEKVWQVPEELCGTTYCGQSDGYINDWEPSSNWYQGGPIFSDNFSIIAGMNPVLAMWPTGDDLLPFLMRAFVEIEFGEYVEVEAA